jgi:hypothetical protein
MCTSKLRDAAHGTAIRPDSALRSLVAHGAQHDYGTSLRRIRERAQAVFAAPPYERTPVGAQRWT